MRTGRGEFPQQSITAAESLTTRLVYLKAKFNSVMKRKDHKVDDRDAGVSTAAFR